MDMINAMSILTAFVDIHKGDNQRTFNGITNLLLKMGDQMTTKEWDMAIYLAECCYPAVWAVNHGYDYNAINAVIDYITDTDDKLCNINYAAKVLQYRGLWDKFCAYNKQDE